LAERDGYIPGVPCWVDTTQPDPDTAVAFYSGLFGWECEDTMPDGSEAKYFVARIRGGAVAAISSVPDGAPSRATWNTYIWVDSADEAAARVRDAGGSVLTEPFDVFDAGRMAVFADPEGAVFCVWQAMEHKGARVVNEHGALGFNILDTHDLARAKEFYGAVFGWTTLDLGNGEFWTLPAYGDHLEQLAPGTRQRSAELGAAGFENVVAAIRPASGAAAAQWVVQFMTDDADATAARAAELGGAVRMQPTDVPWARITVVADPQGATFTASQFVAENRDLAAEEDVAANGR
jgi:predicted enzyme related to lactoylglutathione lyase